MKWQSTFLTGLMAIAIVFTVGNVQAMKITHQGMLTDPSGVPLTGGYSMMFNIYATSAGPTSLWSETQAVTVTNGLFTVELGSVTPLPSGLFSANPTLYLGIQVETDPEISPRTQLNSSPYAFMAENVEGFETGPGNTNTGLYSFVGGQNNTNRADLSSILGGDGNTVDVTEFADTTFDTTVVPPPPGAVSIQSGSPFFRDPPGIGLVVGGHINFVCGNHAVIVEGWQNINCAAYGFIGTGFRNRIFAPYGGIVTGQRNEVNAAYSFIGSGFRNLANSFASVIGGGVINTTATGFWGEVIGGGWANRANDHFSTIGGGLGNSTIARSSTVGGGERNTSTGAYSTTSGGELNNALGAHSTVGGGRLDTATSIYSTVAGGVSNNAFSPESFIGGGSGNRTEGQASAIGGGEGNLTSLHEFQFIGGGQSNIAAGPLSTIGGGQANETSTWATVGGGVSNKSINEFTFIGGGFDNIANAHAAVIGGGLGNLSSNRATTVGGGEINSVFGTHGFIGGGFSNSIQSDTSAIAGGSDNTVTGVGGFIGAGLGNTVTGSSGAISGGNGNLVGGNYGVIGGGERNIVGPGEYSVVPGGLGNEATDPMCFAAGTRAKAKDSCSFVWADCCEVGGIIGSLPLESPAPRTFSARATNGFYFVTSCDSIIDPAAGIGTGVYVPAGGSMWMSGSSRTLKKNITPVDENDILDRVEKMPIYRWSYKTQSDDIEHIGPMAEDFYETFNIGENSQTIGALDPAGVSLAATKALIKENNDLKERLDRLEKLVSDLMSQ